jgi:hypothetical protein
MRSITEMVTGLRVLAGLSLPYNKVLLDDAANYIEGTTENLRQQAEQLTAMRVRLEQVRPLMEDAADVLEDVIIQGCAEELPIAIRAMLRWWEPGTTEPVSISHWGVIE